MVVRGTLLAKGVWPQAWREGQTVEPAWVGERKKDDQAFFFRGWPFPPGVGNVAFASGLPEKVVTGFFNRLVREVDMISGMTLGVLAGLGTAVAWSVSCLVHTVASQRIGVHALLMMRQPLAAVALGLACLAVEPLVWYPWGAWGLALLSGFFGIALGDWLFYESVMRIGVRAAQVCQSFNACITAVLGVIFLDEYLGVQGMVGIAIATGGIILVVLAEQRGPQVAQTSPRGHLLGIMLALGSALALGLGMIASKDAMQTGMSPLLLAFLRNVMASIFLWSAGFYLHRITSTLSAMRTQRSVFKLLAVGCIFGTAGGMWLSMVALDYAPAAVASTLIGLQPVVLLFMTGVMERRCPALGSILGSILACAGAAILLMR